MLVLDADAGRGPYRKLFRHARYKAQVLEHVDDPPAVLAELFRVLRPGGQIL